MHAVAAISLVAGLWIAGPAAPQAPAPVADLVPPTDTTVTAVRGTFRDAAEGLVLVSADQYDNAAFASPWLDGRTTIEVELTHRSGLIGGGLMFGCRDADRAPPTFGQMVRFDTGGELLLGTFQNGQFEPGRRLRMPVPIAIGQRVTLRLDIDSASERMSIAVDGAVVAADLPLRFPAGRVALQGSMGEVAFHRLKLASSPLEPARLRWPVAFRPVDDGFLLWDPRGGTWHLSRDDPEPSPRADEARPPTTTAIAGARIHGGLVRWNDGSTFDGKAIGGMFAVDLRQDAGGHLLVLDQLGTRIVEVPKAGDGKPDRLVFMGHRMRLDPPTPLRVASPGGTPDRTARPTDWSPELAPSTRYIAYPTLDYRSWPSSATDRPVPFESPPPPGLMRIRRVHLVVGIFGNVGATADEARALPPLPLAGYARIERELHDTATWYFAHSGRRLWIDLTFVQRPEPVAAGELSSTGEANGEPPVALLRELADAANVPFAEVTGFAIVMDRRVATPDGKEFRRFGRGGGLTLGAHGRSYGLSWWFVPGTPGYDGWLLCHEFHHQLDALFEIAGHPEYPFNHFAPSLHNVGFFGEHWDGNRWIVAGWPDHLWDALTRTDEVLVTDADGDRVPDADPRLPFDEDRFGSAPDRADTDGDGLDDGAEARVGTWLTNSGFEVQLGPRLEPNPRLPDTDGDGTSDAIDALPLLAIDPVLRADAWCRLRAIDDPRLSVVTRLRIHDGAIELRTETAAAADVQIQVLLDLDADGWFAGRINARIHARGAGARVTEILDASSDVEWPTSRSGPHDELDVTLDRAPDAVTLTIRPKHGLTPGSAFGLGIGYRGAVDRAQDPRWWTVFEPHRLVRFEIEK